MKHFNTCSIVAVALTAALMGFGFLLVACNPSPGNNPGGDGSGDGNGNGGTVIFSLTNVDNTSDAGDLALNGARAVTTATLDGTTYLFVAGSGDSGGSMGTGTGSGVSVFSVDNRGMLTNVDNAADTSSLALKGARSVTTATIGNTLYLFVAGEFDNGVSVFSFNSTTETLSFVDDVTDSATLALNGPSSVTTTTIDGTLYLFVASRGSNNISVFSVDNSGTLTFVDGVVDNANLALRDAVAVSTARIGTANFLFVAAREDDGLSVFSVDRSGMLAHVDDVTDDAMLAINSARSVATATVEGTLYIFVAGPWDNGVSVFSFNSTSGMLASVYDVTDDAMLELNVSHSVTTATVGGRTYLFVAGNRDDGVSAFRVNANGSLTNVYNVTDDATLNLDGAIAVTTATVGTATYLFVAGSADDGVSVFRINH